MHTLQLIIIRVFLAVVLTMGLPVILILLAKDKYYENKRRKKSGKQTLL
jgi:hypothetical protein